MEKYVKTEVVSLKTHPELNEKWVQKKIEEDPSMIGLGELNLKDTERPQCYRRWSRDPPMAVMKIPHSRKCLELPAVFSQIYLKL